MLGVKDEHNWHIDEEVIEYLKEINSGVLGYRTKEREVSEEERSISKKIGLAIDMQSRCSPGQSTNEVQQRPHRDGGADWPRSWRIKLDHC